MTNKEIMQIAMNQSAIDFGCEAGDFKKTENKVVISNVNPNARKYLKLPHYCGMASYGTNVVASVNAEIVDEVKAYIEKYPLEHCFETPNLYALNNILLKRNMQICFMSEYSLPDVSILTALPCNYALKVLIAEDFKDLYVPEWSNALCEDRKHLDVLGVGAYNDKNELIGFAGCSADCDMMWQIGIDVLPKYRHQGIAAALTSRLAIEILNRGKVPFYCCAWSNMGSIRNAIKSGFRPAWAEMAAKSIEFVANMNK